MKALLLQGPIALELLDPNTRQFIIHLSRMTPAERTALAEKYRRWANDVDRYSGQVARMAEPQGVNHHDNPIRN